MVMLLVLSPMVFVWFMATAIVIINASTVYDSNNTIKQTIAKFNKRDKENITDACSLIVTQFDKIRRKRKIDNSRKLARPAKVGFYRLRLQMPRCYPIKFSGNKICGCGCRRGRPQTGRLVYTRSGGLRCILHTK